MTNYYFDPDAGNDGNTGLSEGQAWKTLTKHDTEAGLGTFGGGDYVLWKRGCVVRGTLTVANQGSFGFPLTYGGYGAGVNCTFMGSDSILGVSGDWTNLGGNLWQKNIGAITPYAVWFDDELGDNDAAPSALGMWSYSNPNLTVYCTQNPTLQWSTMEVAQRTRGIYVNGKNYVTVNNINVSHVANSRWTADLESQSGICFYGSEHGEVYSCAVSRCGTGIGFHKASNHGIIRNNYITNCYSEFLYPYGCGIWNEGSNCNVYLNTVSLQVERAGALSTVYGGVGIQLPIRDNVAGYPNFFPDNCAVYSNAVSNYWYYGIHVHHVYAQGNRAIYLDIYGNTVHTSKKTSGDSDGIACGGPGSIAGSEISHVNIFKNHVYNIYNCGIHLADAFGKSSTIYLNLVHDCGFFDWNQGGIKFHKHGVSCVRNTVHRIGIANQAHPSSCGIRCWNAIIATPVVSVISGNAVYDINDTSGYAIWCETAGNAIGEKNCVYPVTGANYNNFTNTNGLEADPLFIDAAGGDYDLDPDSPCIDAGVAIAGVTEDINGYPIPNGNAPDIGCHEAQTIAAKSHMAAVAYTGLPTPGYVSPLARRRRR